MPSGRTEPYPIIDLAGSPEGEAWAGRCYERLSEIGGVDSMTHFNPRLSVVQAKISNSVQRDEYPQAIDNRNWEMTPCQGKYVTAVFADGGVAYVNPSPYGGAWGYCHVDQHEHRVGHGVGVFAPWEPSHPNMPCLGIVGPDSRATGQPCVSNNQMEFYALLAGLEALPDGWSGFAYSDSQLTLGRFFWNWNPYASIPPEWVERLRTVMRRLGTVTPVLLSGHPGRRDLAARVSLKNGRMVSLHNVWCDEQCTRLTSVMPPDLIRRLRYPQEA